VKLDLKAPHQTYRRSDGTRLTGVTTYLGVLAKPQLLGWYAAQERDGIKAALAVGGNIEAMFPTKKDGKPLWFAEAKRDKAADLGTVTHARCEAHDLGVELEPHGIPADLYEQSLHGLSRYVEWKAEAGIKMVHVEQVLIYDDGKMAFGGTADRLAVDSKGRWGILDLKTSKASPWWPYDEVFGQVAAYGKAADNDPAVAIHCEWHKAIRIGNSKDDEIQVYDMSDRQVEAGWALFQSAYGATEAKKALEKLRK
jgi:hypothetical protein